MQNIVDPSNGKQKKKKPKDFLDVLVSHMVASLLVSSELLLYMRLSMC